MSMSYIFVVYQNKNSSFLIYALELLKLNYNLIFPKYLALELFYILYELLHMYGMVNTEELPVFLVYDFFLFSVTLVVNDSYTKTSHPYTAICTFYDWNLSLTFCGIPPNSQFSYQDIFCCYAKTNIVAFFYNISVMNFALCPVQNLSEVN